MPYKNITWQEDVHYHNNYDNARTRLSGVLSITTGKAGDTEPITVHASLQGTLVTVPLIDGTLGKMVADTDNKKGWFKDLVKVTMKLTDQHGQIYLPLSRIQSSPGTVNASGSITSSVTVSFGGSASGGFFGPAPTGNVGISGSTSNTNSFSETLNDFIVTEAADRSIVSHTYKMEKLANGAPYERPFDLLPDPTKVLAFNAFDPIKLNNPPPLAINSLPLLDQAYWQAGDNRLISEHVKIEITVETHIAWVEVAGTAKFPQNQNAWTWVGTHRHSVPLELDKLKQSTHSAPL
ncbi:hypothetical protein SAMN05192553_104142 [Cyclobacterium xiamenense]|uniref:Uncharacterized protein n=2 Tax=Cyclobacterium xiamenense TaxID=1297121 RepID=A0A1H6ZE65_9BACT|nr:hypothetical protein SAMN05192553_104142 [Cyclobacterium xiamenense]